MATPKALPKNLFFKIVLFVIYYKKNKFNLLLLHSYFLNQPFEVRRGTKCIVSR